MKFTIVFRKLALVLFLTASLYVYAQEPMPTAPVQEDTTIEQQLLGAMVEVTIMAFENPRAKETLNQFSEFIKDEYTYQFIIQKIDKFILTNELDEYEDQAEALKDALTKMRELYIESEKKAVDNYQQLKEEHEQQKKEQELKENHVIEV